MRNVTDRPPTGRIADDPSFSPDGKWLAFVALKEISTGYSGDVVSTVLLSTLWLARGGLDGRVRPGRSSGGAYGGHTEVLVFGCGQRSDGPSPFS
jgi:hypothetical protein